VRRSGDRVPPHAHWPRATPSEPITAPVSTPSSPSLEAMLIAFRQIVRTVLSYTSLFGSRSVVISSFPRDSLAPVMWPYPNTSSSEFPKRFLNAARNFAMLTAGCAGGWVSTCCVVVGGPSASASEPPLQPLAAIATALRPATTVVFRRIARGTDSQHSIRAPFERPLFAPR
jgi:hypothetical protein